MRWLVLLVALLASGCGAPAADLFVVTRTGTDRNANLTMLVADDGSVTCNGKQHPMTGKELLTARQLTRDMVPQAELNVALPPGPGSILSYKVRMQAGTVAFSDTSKPLPKAFTQVTAFTADVSENVCGINRQ
jgi:hypothetical protein